jgi:hypothetical protein
VKESTQHLVTEYESQFGIHRTGDTGTPWLEPYDTYKPFTHFAALHCKNANPAIASDVTDQVLGRAKEMVSRDDTIRRDGTMSELSKQLGRRHSQLTLEIAEFLGKSRQIVVALRLRAVSCETLATPIGPLP